MSDGFVDLAEYLKRAAEAATADPVAEHAVEQTAPAAAMPGDAVAASDAFGRDVRLARAALEDALAAHLGDLLRDLAIDVLARELRLAPADIDGVVRDVLARLESEFPIAVRVNPNDRVALQHLALPVVDDPGLRAGDVVIEVRNGTIDASLGVRVEALLAKANVS